MSVCVNIYIAASCLFLCFVTAKEAWKKGAEQHLHAHVRYLFAMPLTQAKWKRMKHLRKTITV